MLDFLDQIPVEWRPLALVVFIVVGAGGAALSYLRGKKAGPEAPKVQEFYAAGALHDMGPVKELVEGVGLLVQQQIKANIHAEATAKAINRLANTIDGQIEEERREKEIAEEVQRQLKDRG
jgi:hypothetical protein